MEPQRLVIGNPGRGLTQNPQPFFIDNDAFPTLENCYVWRGRIARKRGTDLLGRLQRTLPGLSGMAQPSLGNTDGGGNFSGNIFSILGLATSQPNASIVPGAITVTVGAQTFTEPSPPNGTLVGSTGGTGTINYATGALTLAGTAATTAVTIKFSYYPGLPVMGLEDLSIGAVSQEILISFDTMYSYGFNQGTNLFYDTTFYKSTQAPFVWNGNDYDQIYSANYLGVNTIAQSTQNTGCLWATNGNQGSAGMQFITITNVTIANAGMPNAVSTITTSANHGLTNHDFVFINEIKGTGSPMANLNGDSGQVTVTELTTFTLPTPNATGTYNSGGIVQYMTQSHTSTIDGIRWYDGDPTASANFGWVNFCPPLNQYDQVTNPNPYYLVGADIITPFKNRLIFSGVYLTTSALGNAGVQYYPNRIVYSQVGTPFYAAPLPFAISTQAPDPAAWFQNVAGRGGFLTMYYDEPFGTVHETKDVLIYGTEAHQLMLVYTLDDSQPFYFQTLNSEYGSQNTFSGVILDDGVLSIGDYGIVATNQGGTGRIDLQIPDQVFQIGVANNANYRVTSVRDFRNEWVYFTYVNGNTTSRFPNQSLFYNYRNQSWALFDETYTHYGTFRRSSFRTWASIGSVYPTWADWNDPWNFGGDEAFYPDIVGGNQHGFVLITGRGTGESTSKYITAVTTATLTITSPNHGLNDGDFVVLSGLIGVTIQDASGNPVSIFKIEEPTANTFVLTNPTVNGLNMTGTYLGGGIYARLSVPFMQTKQFPFAWQAGRGARVGVQKYLFQTTSTGQVTVEVYSSQNADTPDNDQTQNPYLIYSNVVLTTPEPGLYGGDSDYRGQSAQIWHRQQNSFNGNTIQLGFTLSDQQMFNPMINSAEIILHSIIIEYYPGPSLASYI